MPTNLTPDEIARRLAMIYERLHGLAGEIHRLEQDIQQLQQHAPRTDAELAAQRARNGVYTIGPSETKVIT